MKKKIVGNTMITILETIHVTRIPLAYFIYLLFILGWKWWKNWLPTQLGPI